MNEGCVRLQLEPLAVLLRHTLHQLQAQDTEDIFALPVPVDEVNCSVVFSDNMTDASADSYK